MSAVELSKYYVLGFDPGAKNFAYSLVEMEVVSRGGKTTLVANVKKTGLLKYTVTSAREAKNQLLPFISLVSMMLDNGNVPITIVGVEQYQNRGFGTKMTEIVNIMIGAMLQAFQHLDIEIFQASSWKNRVTKIFDLKDEYRKITCTEHELDATLIAVYKAFSSAGISPFYGYKRGMFDKLARQVETASTTVKRKRKYKNAKAKGEGKTKVV